MNNTPAIADAIARIITATGEDLNRPGLKDTPQRAARALAHNLAGYTQTVDAVVGEALFPSSNHDLVVVRSIEFYSYCEHHLLPFFGRCHVGYLPNGVVLGLSKVARIVDVFAKRLQIQEALTMQIGQAIEAAVNPVGVGVSITAQHLCMMMRGVNKQHSETTTAYYSGHIKSDPALKSEFLASIAQ